MLRDRMMARLLLLVGICLSTAGAYRCSWGGQSGSGSNCNGYGGCSGSSSSSGSGSGGYGSSGGGTGTTFATSLTLLDSTGVVTTSFVMGEPIRFDLEVRNRTNQTVQVQFAGTQTYDFVVFDQAASRVRWQWSDGLVFPQTATTLTFDPYSSKTFSVVWNGALADGSQLPVGAYRARGVMMFDAFAGDPLATNETGSGLMSFSVR